MLSNNFFIMEDSKSHGCRVLSVRIDDPGLPEKARIVDELLDKGEKVDDSLEAVEEAVLPIKAALERWEEKRRKLSK